MLGSREQRTPLENATARSAVNEDAGQGAENAARPAREVLESHEPVGERQAGGAPVELLLADRFPELVDRAHRVLRDLLDRQLEMLRPQAEPRFTGEVRVGLDVSVSTLPWVRTPRRGVSVSEIF